MLKPFPFLLRPKAVGDPHKPFLTGKSAGLSTGIRHSSQNCDNCTSWNHGQVPLMVTKTLEAKLCLDPRNGPRIYQPADHWCEWWQGHSLNAPTQLIDQLTDPLLPGVQEQKDAIEGLRYWTRAAVVLFLLWLVFGFWQTCHGAPAPAQPKRHAARCLQAVPAKLEPRAQSKLAAELLQIPWNLLRGNVDVESSWLSKQRSSRGAVGLMQVLPETVAYYRNVPTKDMTAYKLALDQIGQRLRNDSHYAICWGSAVLAWELEKCNQDWGCAVAGYYAGWGVSEHVTKVLAAARREP